VSVSIRRAEPGDLDFMLELALHEEVEPFLGAVSAKDAAALREEIDRSSREPHDFGRFVIEVDGAPAGAMGFEAVNRRSRIAHLERLAVHPSHRGRRVADEAASILQRELVVHLGYHRLQLEIYGFNERAQRHAERAGFVREGSRRRAYWRHGDWTDGVLFGLVADELDVPAAISLLHAYLGVHNECVRTGEWSPLAEWFADDAELSFAGVPVGPFRGRDEIEAAYRERPPDDEVLTYRVELDGDRAVARYGWRAHQPSPAGDVLLTPAGGVIGRLAVTFEP
jgi:RimJ/RimL family protein N-acetyltransferase